MRQEMILNMALCDGRHEIPQATDGAIFGNIIIDPMQTKRMEIKAFNRIWDVCRRLGYLVNASSIKPELENTEYEDTLCIQPGVKLNLYVTGLTVALVAVLNICRSEGIQVTLYHYDLMRGNYYPQVVL